MYIRYVPFTTEQYQKFNRKFGFSKRSSRNFRACGCINRLTISIKISAMRYINCVEEEILKKFDQIKSRHKNEKKKTYVLFNVHSLLTFGRQNPNLLRRIHTFISSLLIPLVSFLSLKYFVLNNSKHKLDSQCLLFFFLIFLEY